MFQKILIANRGEIAVRIIRACRDLGIISVAVYSEADREALHAQIADESVCIGPANPRDSYLNMQNLISAALASGAQAIHPGFGFLSENAEFAQMAIDNVMLKAAAGGGGKGIRVAYSPEELKSAYDTASSEAQANFGDGRLYIERYVENPRHIEVQIMGDTQGHVVHLFERECSIQRRHQKLLEEAPSCFLDPETRQKMCTAARNLAQKVGYINAGTVEFLVDRDKNFFFCEMNTRIQVEHPGTEQGTGVDLVCEQIRVASGEPLSFTQDDLILRGHAIECRINAEDPNRDFAPCPGRINGMHLPGGPGVRIDTAAYQGYMIPPFYDSMIGKLIVSGCDRAQAIARMRRALAETLFDGVTTSTDFHLHLLSSDAFVSGDFHTNSIANGDFDR